MPATYEPIATQTLGASASSIQFTSIPDTYTDLVLVFTGTTPSFADCAIRFNGDTGSNYSDTIIYGTGSVAGSGRHSNLTFARGAYVSSSQTVNIWNIMNYSNTTTNKTFLNRSNTPGSEVDGSVGLYRSTAKISSITLFPDGTSFNSGSVFSLFGIKAA